MKKSLNTEVCGIDCTLCNTCRHPHINMEGNPKTARILFVGEAPGELEDKVGMNFVGQAGKLLRDTLALHKITDFCIINSVRCRPPGNRTPTTKEIKICNAFLNYDIDSIKNLELIVPLGNIAMVALLGTKFKSITKFSGKLLVVNGRKYLPVYHPAYILRNRNELKVFEEHIGRIGQAMIGSLVNPNDFGTYTIVDSLSKWDDLVKKIMMKGYFIYDIETTGLSPFVKEASIRCIGFSTEPREGYVVQIEKPVINDMDMGKIAFDMKMLFESNKIGKVGHNVKFDNLFMEVVRGVKVNNTIWDTKYGQFLINENESNDLKDMAWKVSQCGGYEKRLEAEPQDADIDKLLPYCCIDCDITHRAYIRQKKDSSKEVQYLMTNLMLPATKTLTESEIKGIKIDINALDICEANTDRELARIDREINNEKSVQDFIVEHGTLNKNSHIQLSELLFKYEGLEPISYTEKSKKPSTNREVLEALSSQSHLCSLLVDYSLYFSMKSKMIKEIREHCIDGRIHTFYSLTQTVTGRTASRKPNMQNITKGEKDVVGIRNVFVADPEYILAEFDMSQHELRCMAELAGDKALARALESGDVHRSTAASIFNKPPEMITEDERRDAKAFNFGLIYGITTFGIQRQIKCDEVMAAMYIDRFFKAYPKTKLWMDNTARFAKTHGYVTSITGRTRHFPIWDELDEKSVREGINMPVQSLASDILLYGMISVSNFLKSGGFKSYIALEVHDSIVCNIHKDEMDLIPKIQHMLTQACKSHIRFVLPLKVDVKIGETWGKMKEYIHE